MAASRPALSASNVLTLQASSSEALFFKKFENPEVDFCS